MRNENTGDFGHLSSMNEAVSWRKVPSQSCCIRMAFYKIEILVTFHRFVFIAWSLLLSRALQLKASLTSGVLIASIHSIVRQGNRDRGVLGMLTSGCSWYCKPSPPCSCGWLGSGHLNLIKWFLDWKLFLLAAQHVRLRHFTLKHLNYRQ